MNFSKIQGTGNDFIYINCLQHDLEDPSRLAIRICNRYYGVGADGIILILPSKVADFKMKIYNSDGSEAEMCGNGIRGLGKYLYDNEITKKTSLNIETLAGIKTLELGLENNKVNAVKVSMGNPLFLYSDSGKPVKASVLKINNRLVSYTPISMGNPHAVIIVENIEDFNIEKFGPLIENNEAFPAKTNVEFVEIIDRNNIKMRVWERGVGETLACGTGASASVVATNLLGYTSDNVNVKMRGGELIINWDKNKNTVYLAGKAEHVFNGTYECGYV
jgi:diaminopimelate epimerase